MELYFWGANSHFQSGAGVKEEQFESPIQVYFPEKPETIIEIVGGGGHTLILTSDGKVFAAGWNNKGQLGLGGFFDSPIFLPIPIKNDIKKIRAGWDISGFISDSNEFLVCGNNQYEQFGTKDPLYMDFALKISLPQEIELSDVTFGLRHTSILSKSGTLLLFGQSRCLRIAEKMNHPDMKIGKFEHNKAFYVLIMFKSHVSSIKSGQYFTLAYTIDHRMFLIGENKHAFLSNQEIDISRVSLIQEISAGWTHFAFLEKTGVLHTLGRNNYHQLGRESGENTIVQIVGEKVNRVICGSEHTAILTETGKCLTFGWNEHGNCGVQGVEDVKRPTEVKFPKKCRMIGTGCGFCFALIEK